MSVGYVDLHLHLLPGVDDGCQTMEDTLALARALVSLGYTHAAPSPHHRPEYASAATALERLEEVRVALGEAKVALELSVNAENAFLDERLMRELGTPALRKVGGPAGRYLLVEAPYTTPLPALPDLVFRMKLKGVTPLIAHPERCLEFERKGRAEELVAAGALLQLDLGSLIGRYGKDAQKIARRLLEAGLYAVAATDLHSPVRAEAWVSESMRALEKAAGARSLRSLLSENPAAILRGEPIG